MTLDMPTFPGPIFYGGAMLILSFFGGKIASYVNFPRISGYLLMGVFVGPHAFGFFSEEIISTKLDFIVDLALGFIAFSIGGSLTLQGIKKLGKSILTVTMSEASFVFIAIVPVVYFIFPHLVGGVASKSDFLGVGLILGAISAPTAPAATLALIHQYRSSGPLTTMILGVVALDDALTIIFFSFALPFALMFINSAQPEMGDMITHIYLDLSISIAMGLGFGFIVNYFTKWMHTQHEALGVILGTILMLYGIAEYANASPLLSTMVFGFIVANAKNKNSAIFNAMEEIEEPVFGMFFALAGMHMDLSILPQAGLLGLVLLGTRFFGKFTGSQFGGIISGLEATPRKYLGLALLPQAGVTIGLLIEASNLLKGHVLITMMVNAVLASVIFNEILAPFFVKYALLKSGEAKP